MATKNTAQVLIGGKIITLSGYESKEYLQNKLAELSELPGYSRQPMETKHTLLSLNIADDYFKAKKQAEVYEQDLQLKDKEMYDLKHELISLQVQIENSKKEEVSIDEEKARLEGKIAELEKELNELLSE